MKNLAVYGVLALFLVSLAQTGYLLLKVDQWTELTRATGKASSDGTASINICINHPPTLSVPCDATVKAETAYNCTLNGSDGDNAVQNLTYNVSFSNGTLFALNSSTGVFNFTPSNSQLGNHTLNFTVEDGSNCSSYEASQIFDLFINRTGNRPPVLVKNLSGVTMTEGEMVSAFFLSAHFTDPDGDTLTYTVSSQSFFAITILSSSEVVINATTCGKSAQVIFTAQDPSNETADSNLVTISCTSTASAAVSSSESTGQRKCVPNVQCYDFTGCSKDGRKTKRCLDENGCGDDVYITVICKAPQQEECLESWSCSEWGLCLLNNRHYRTCSDSSNCKSSKARPVEEEPCRFIPSCFDGLKNGDEQGIDCGGSCKACVLLETPGLIKEDIRPITYVLLALTILGFALLLANKYYHKQIHRLLIRGGWYLSGRYEKALLLDVDTKRLLLQKLDDALRDLKKKPASKVYEDVMVLVEEYFRKTAITPKTSPYYKKSRITRYVPGPLSAALDHFYGHVRYLMRRNEPEDELVRYAIEEFRAIINLTSSAEVKVSYDTKEVKVDEYDNPSDKVRLQIRNAWVALQFDKIELARDRYEDLVVMYESLDDRSKRSLYSDVYRLYQEIKYANSVLDLEA